MHVAVDWAEKVHVAIESVLEILFHTPPLNFVSSG